MNPLPSMPEIGTLEIIEVYEYFDGPCLFAAQNECDQLFLVALAEDERHLRRWLIVPMSKRRYEHVRSGGVDLHDAFAAAEGGYVYFLCVPTEGDPQGEWRNVETLVDDELPLPGEVLDLDTATLRQGADIDVTRIARQSRREVVAIRLAFRGFHRPEAPAGMLGQILEGIQALLKAIGQGVVAKPTRRGTLPANVVREMELDVVSVFAGSFGVELHARQSSDLFGESHVGEALELMTRLFEVTGENENSLKQLLSHLKGRSMSKYRDLLLRIIGSVDELDWTWGSPKIDRGGRVRLTADRAKKAIGIIGELSSEEPMEFTIVGRLIGINVRTKSYELWDVEENRKYAGRVVEEALPTVEHATINDIYVAIIREEAEVMASGEVEIKYKLLSLTPIGGDPAGPDGDDPEVSQRKSGDRAGH